VTLALASGASFADTRAAAEQEDAGSQNNLGVMYGTGNGVPQDYVEAVKWYRLAAEQGNAAAQYNLGLMYDNGQGVPQDYVRAHTWFNLAASRGDANGSNNRDIVAKRMTREQIAEAQRMAREWTPKPE
jgi:TPR repeat protein